MSGWDLFWTCFYCWVAGLHAEYNHNHTCKFWYSVIWGLLWPIDLVFFKKKNPKEVPKYYKDQQ